MQKLKPFFIFSKEFEFDPIAAFYLKQYAVNKGMEIYKKLKSEGNDDQNIKENMNIWISDLEKLKGMHPDKFTNKEENLDHVEEITNGIFFKADNDEREGNFSKDTIKGFQATARFFEVLEYFGSGNEDYAKKKKYSLVKAVEINKKLKNPELYQKPKKEDKIDEEPVNNDNFNNELNEKFNSLSKYDKKQAPCSESVSRIMDFVKNTPELANNLNFNKPKSFIPQDIPKPIEKKQNFQENFNENQVKPSNYNNMSSAVRIKQSNLREKMRKECENALNNLIGNKIFQAKSDIAKALEFIEQHKQSNN